MKEEQGRRLHLELLRMIAIYLVVLNHTGYNGYLYAMQVPDRPVFWPLLAVSVLVKTAVPLFFMVSGALLLRKEESLGTLLKKRVLRYGLVLLLFSLLSYLYGIRDRLESFSLYYFLTQLYSYRLADSYWFLYQYLAYLLVLPFLRALVRAMGDRDYRYLVGLWVALGVTELLAFFLLKTPAWRSETFVLFVSEYTVFFPLLGYYLEQRVPPERYTRRRVLWALAAALAAVALSCAAVRSYCTRFDDWTISGAETYLGSLTCVPALSVYFCVRALFLRHQPGPLCRRVLCFFGSCSFGVYLLQHIWLEQTAPLRRSLASLLGTFAGTLVWVLCICVLGSGVAWLLRQLPGLKKLL